MSNKVQEALNLVKELTKAELEEFILGMREIFIEKENSKHQSPRVLALNITPEQVWQKLTEGLLKDEKDKIYYHYAECLERGEILSDTEDVEFNLENIEMDPECCHGEVKTLLGPRMFGKVAGVGCQAGGDWEWPIFFIIYLGVDGVLHGYFPKDGNPYNHDTNSAFGNAMDEEDDEFLLKWLKTNRPDLEVEEVYASEQDGDLMFNKEKILADIQANVDVAL